ncbi:MAG: phosphoribosylanthranilate isomerase [Gammaproteobacteria bacterium]|nr:phosphoribosylanthranilate isomerase [Gammaproteobacteria bacterium]
MRTRIKICGIKTVESASRAAYAGADAFGLVFHEPSIRNISIDKAAEIARQRPAFSDSVAVMVNPTRDFVRAVLDEVKPDYLQFHGEEPAEFCRSFGTRYIRSVRVREPISLSSVQDEYRDASAFLVDAYQSDHYGGTGDVFNWDMVTFDSTIPVILAGGLNDQNIAVAISKVRPYGVDVSSGVETGGSKDIDKIQRFCKVVWDINQGQDW